MRDIRLGEWLTIAALILGPILAVQAQRFLDSLRERRHRRLQVFHTLMATRAARLSHDHVQALNMVDIEWYGRSVFGIPFKTPGEKAVTNAWRIYADHLNTKAGEGDQLARWVDEGDKLLSKLLYEISRSLGYDFDEVQLRRNIYSPIAHGKQQVQELAFREGLIQILSGERAIAVTLRDALPQGDASKPPALPAGPNDQQKPVS